MEKDNKDKINLSSLNTPNKSSKSPGLKNPFKKKDAYKRDGEGKFTTTTGSGGLQKTRTLNVKRALPLIALIALVGGFFVYQSFAYQETTTTKMIKSWYQECHRRDPNADEIKNWEAKIFSRGLAQATPEHQNQVRNEFFNTERCRAASQVQPDKSKVYGKKTAQQLFDNPGVGEKVEKAFFGKTAYTVPNVFRNLGSGVGNLASIQLATRYDRIVCVTVMTQPGSVVTFISSGGVARSWKNKSVTIDHRLEGVQEVRATQTVPGGADMRSSMPTLLQAEVCSDPFPQPQTVVGNIDGIENMVAVDVTFSTSRHDKNGMIFLETAQYGVKEVTNPDNNPPQQPQPAAPQTTQQPSPQSPASANNQQSTNQTRSKSLVERLKEIFRR